MRRPLIFGTLTLGMALILFAVIVVIHAQQAESAGTNSPGFITLNPTQALASMNAFNASIATERAMTPTRPGEAATLTAVVKPTPTCVSNTVASPAKLPTVDPSNPIGGFLATQGAQNAPYVITPSKTTDLAPQIPKEQKGEYVIRHADCTYESFLVPNDQANVFSAKLSPGDVIVSAAPPQEIFGKHPGYIGPSVTPAPGAVNKPTAPPLATPTR